MEQNGAQVYDFQQQAAQQLAQAERILKAHNYQQIHLKEGRSAHELLATEGITAAGTEKLFGQLTNLTDAACKTNEEVLGLKPTRSSGRRYMNKKESAKDFEN